MSTRDQAKGSMRAPLGIFEGKVLIIAGSALQGCAVGLPVEDLKRSSYSHYKTLEKHPNPIVGCDLEFCVQDSSRVMLPLSTSALELEMTRSR